MIANVRGGFPGGIRLVLSAGMATMAGVYVFACFTKGGALAAPPFFPPWHPPDLWTMSQRAGSASYLLFSAGFSLAVYAGFVQCCDRHGRRLNLRAAAIQGRGGPFGCDPRRRAPRGGPRRGHLHGDPWHGVGHARPRGLGRGG